MLCDTIWSLSLSLYLFFQVVYIYIYSQVYVLYIYMYKCGYMFWIMLSWICRWSGIATNLREEFLSRPEITYAMHSGSELNDDLI